MEVIRKVKILNRLGLHLRAAAQLVSASSKFKCRVLIRKGYQQADGKSLLNLIALAAGYGSEVTLVFDGEDASEGAGSDSKFVSQPIWGKGIKVNNTLCRTRQRLQSGKLF